jgi:hypothetical protein
MTRSVALSVLVYVPLVRLYEGHTLHYLCRVMRGTEPMLLRQFLVPALFEPADYRW